MIACHFGWRMVGCQVVGVIYALALAGCSGDLNAVRSSHVIYDQDKDEFGHMRVYRHIHVVRPPAADEKKDPAKAKKDRQEALDYLASLWKDRDKVLMTPVLLEDWGEPQYLFVSPREYKAIFIEKRRGDAQTEKSPIDLSQVTIRPGEFFLSPEGTLCYYHACYLPGRVIDEFFASQTESLNKSLKEGFVEEQTRRKGAPQERSTWEELRKKLASLNDDKVPSPKYNVLDDESLRLLIEQAGGGKLKFVRARQRISIGFRLSAKDAAEMETTKQTIDQLAADIRAQGKSPLGDRSNDALGNALLRIASRFELSTAADGAVTVGIDLTKTYPAAAPSDVAVPAAALAAARDDLHEVEKRGIPVSRTLTFEKILAEFAAGRKE